MSRALTIALTLATTLAGGACSCGGSARAPTHASGNPTTCTVPGLAACGDTCLDLTSDFANCGACGVRCLQGELCTDARCIPDCGQGLAFEGLPRSLLTENATDWVALDLDLDGELDWAGIGIDGHVRVFFAGEPFPGFVSKTTATRVAVGDVDGDGLADLLGAYMDFVLLAGTGRAPRELLLDQETSLPQGVFLADVNGDGRADRVLESYSIGISLARGDGTLGSPQRLPFQYPVGMAVGDIDGDGLADLVTFGRPRSGSTARLEIAVAHGTAAGIGSPVVVFSSEDNDSKYKSAVAIADCDGDGKRDIVTGRHVLRQTANGFSALATDIPLELGTVAVADLDGDGRDDIVLGLGYSTRVFRASGNCQYTAAELPTSGAGQPVIADINHDGALDIGRAGGWLRAHSPGEFDFLQGVAASQPGVIASSADYDRNRRTEVVLVSLDAVEPYVFGVRVLGFATAGAALQVTTPILRSPTYSVQTSDLDGDGRQELLLAVSALNSGATLVYSFRPRGDSVESLGSTEVPSTFGEPPTFVDISGDGRADAVVAVFNAIDHHFAISIAASNSEFLPIQNVEVASAETVRIEAFAIADRNDDGLPDLVLTGIETSSERRVVIIAMQRAEFTFAESVIQFDETVSYLAHSGPPPMKGNLGVDIDSDGNLDIVTWTKADSFPLETWWLRGRPDGTVEQPARLPGVAFVKDTESQARGALLDFDGDGRQDFVVVEADVLTVRRGSGPATLASAQRIAARPESATLDAGPFADVDGDGIVDYVWFTEPQPGVPTTFFVARGMCPASR